MKAIRLQGVGHVQAKPAGEFKVGEKMAWNFGYTSTIKSVKKETSKSIWFIETSDESGKDWERRFLKTRLVAMA